MISIKYPLFLLTLVLLGLAGYFIFKQREKKEPLYFSEHPQIKPIEKYITATGEVVPQNDINVGSLEAGRVVELLADDNDVVKTGQVLARLDDGINLSGVKNFSALLEAAKAEAAYQELNFKRQQSLFESGQISQDEYQLAERDLLVARNKVLSTEGELEITEQRYNNLFIKSPVNGTVIARRVSLGQMITSRLQATELFIIAQDMRHMEVDVEIDEADVAYVKAGQAAEFTVDAFEDTVFYGTVQQIEYKAKVVESVVTYNATVKVNNEDLLLRPKMTANVKIKVGYDPEALVIPNKALRINRVVLKRVATRLGYGFKPLEKTTKGRSRTVWIVEDNTFKEVRPVFGLSTRKETKIQDGLTSDNLIVTELDEPKDEPAFLKAMFSGTGRVGAA